MHIVYIIIFMRYYSYKLHKFPFSWYGSTKVLKSRAYVLDTAVYLSVNLADQYGAALINNEIYLLIYSKNLTY